MGFLHLKRRASVMALAAILPFCAQAGPMGFDDSWMAMGDVGPNWREAFVNYAITPRDAIGVGATYMRSDDERRSRQLAEVVYTRLLQRWNTKDAQANLWFVGGLGTLKMRDQGVAGGGVKTMVTPGIQFDYETTRVYFSAAGRLYRARHVNHDYASVRAGFSFYEAEYDETQPWLIVEARRMRGLSEQVELTPMLRLISKNYFIEAGVSTSGDPRFNFMYIF